MSTRAAETGGITAVIDHTALTVPDIDVAVEFFTDALGGEVVYRMGPFPSNPSAATEPDRFGRHPDTRPVSIAMVRVGNAVFEIFQFEGTDLRSEAPRWSDAGSFHLALRVDDVASAVERLLAHGIEPLDGIMAGPESGMQVWFCRTSWGLLLELVSYQPDSAMAAAMQGRPSNDPDRT